MPYRVEWYRPSWFDFLSLRTMEMFSRECAPWVGYNRTLWLVSEGMS